MNLNKVLIAGNVGGEPTIRETSGGSKTANFTLATTEYYTNREGDRQETTTWHNVTAFGKTAEFIEKYVGKGRNIFIEGRIRNRKYTTKDGDERSITEIVADNVQPLDRPKDDGGSWTDTLIHGKAKRTAAPKMAAEQDVEKNGFDPTTDDLPFSNRPGYSR